MRCPCADHDPGDGSDNSPNALRYKYSWWAHENPVMAPLGCPHIEYWTVLRDPIERIVSRISQCPDVCIGLEDARAAIRTTAVIEHANEFTGSEVFNNWYVRSLNGPETYKLPLGAVNETHLRRAQRALRKFHVVVPFKHVSEIRIAVSRFLGVCVRTPFPKPQADLSISHYLHGGDVGYSKRLKEFHEDTAFMTLLRSHNEYDVRLHATAISLWERLNKYRSDPCSFTSHSKITHLVRAVSPKF